MKTFQLMSVEKSEGKNVPVTELRQKIQDFLLQFSKGMYEIYNTLTNHFYLFS